MGCRGGGAREGKDAQHGDQTKRRRPRLANETCRSLSDQRGREDKRNSGCEWAGKSEAKRGEATAYNSIYRIPSSTGAEILLDA